MLLRIPHQNLFSIFCQSDIVLEIKTQILIRKNKSPDLFFLTCLQSFRIVSLCILTIHYVFAFDQFWPTKEKVLGTPDLNSFFLTPNYDTYIHLKSQQHFREYETKIMIFNTCFSLFTNNLYINIIYEAQQQNLIIQFTFYKHVAQQQTKWKIFININLLYRTYEIDFEKCSNTSLWNHSLLSIKVHPWPWI